MYNEQLEKLIEMALMDGELTEKEKQILFKKADEFGIDHDEFEMYLIGKESEKQKSIITKASPTTEKHGNVTKCPACGAFVPSLSVKCSDCGFEFKNVKANNSVAQITEKLEQVRIDCDNKEYANKIGDIIGVSESFRLSDVIARQKDVIRNFPVPNTLEDIYELLIFMKHKSIKKIKTKDDYSFRTEDLHGLTDAWAVKYDEVLSKAKFIFRDDPKSLELLRKFDSTEADNLSKPKKKRWPIWKIILVAFLVWLFLYIVTNIGG